MPAPTKAPAPRQKVASSSTPSAPHFLTGALVILIAAFIAFQPALNAGFIWDDNDMLFENHLIQASDGLPRIWSGEFVDYFPLTMSSLWIEWRLWGMKATGYHVTNLLLHALSAILIWRILLRLKVPGAFWAALLFAVHPVTVESVAWVTERKNTLCLFFAALATLSFVRAELVVGQSSRKDEQRRWYFIAIAAFALSLLAKTATVMLPFVFLGVIWWLRRKPEGLAAPARVGVADFVRVIPFFAIAGVLAIVTIWFQYNRAIEHKVVNEADFLQRVVIAGKAIWFYLGKALVPVQLTFVYPRWPLEVSPMHLLPVAAAVVVPVALFLARKRLGSGPLLAFGYFVLLLFPVLGFFSIYFQRYSFVADHWQYFSLIGVIAFIASLVTRFAGDKAPYVLGALAVGCGVLTFQQSKIYKNQETLWRDTLRKNPTCAMAEANWGLYLYQMDRRDEAVAHYEAALKLNPRDDGTLFNYGVVFLEGNKPTEAAEKFRQCLEANPDNKQALMSLAWIRAISKVPGLRNGAEAVRLAERGVEVTKGNDEWMLDTLAASYAEAGRFADAVRTEKRALEVAQKYGRAASLNEMTARLRLYESGRPFHEQ